MAKHHEVFEHTADIGVAARADSLAELFEALAEGLAGVICEPAAVQPVERRAVEVTEEEPDREGLLVDFLWQVLGLLEHERFLVRSVRVSRVEPDRLEAELSGERYDPERHELLSEVKAITWHQLLVAQSESGWDGRVILDL
jgi:SHS2 domain-containing protein